MMAKHRLEADTKCRACNGTGLYVGVCERDGAAVVCHVCKGTGCHKLVVEYEDFEGRQPRADVSRVLEVNVGIVVGVGEDGKYPLEAFGGMPYEDWAAGKVFPARSEMRAFVCPAWWYQSADYSKKPDWRECLGAGRFSRCGAFPTKDRCWARWDAEQENTEARDVTP